IRSGRSAKAYARAGRFCRGCGGSLRHRQKEIIAVGYSNGANIAASVLLLRPETFAGAILFRAMLPLEPQKPLELANVRVWIGAGNYDPIIPTSETQRLVELLRHAGADVTVRFLNAGHAL